MERTKFIPTDKFKLMTHLFHSSLEMNRHLVVNNDSVRVKCFKEDNSELIEKIKKSIIDEYKYVLSNFQITMACYYFLKLKLKTNK